MKKPFIYSLSMFFICSIYSINISAEIKLPAIFNDNMVLQQKTDCAIWGKANKNTKVSIITSWNKKSYSTTASSDGSWKLKVATPIAGGPYQISISDGKILVLKIF